MLPEALTSCLWSMSTERLAFYREAKPCLMRACSSSHLISLARNDYLLQTHFEEADQVIFSLVNITSALSP